MRAYLSFLLVVSVFAAPACKKSSADERASAAAKAPVHVATAAVVEQPMPRYLTLTGALVSNQQSDLAANAAGKVTATFVDRGSYVQKGAVIATLDMRGASMSQREAAANAALATEQAKLAQDECDRSKRLFETGSISKVEYDRQSSQCQQSGQSVAAAQARMDLASKTLGDSTIRAPFAGLIAERYSSVGEYVLPQSRVATLLEVDPIRVQLTVPEEEVPLIKLQQRVEFSTSAYGDETFVGTMRYMGPSLRGNSRDLLVEAIVDNQDYRLRPGMFVTARIALGDAPITVLPTRAIKNDGTLDRVFVVVNRQLEERIVQLGESKGDVVGVTDGVKVGDSVVLDPADTLTDGLAVE
jgi:membrane fusion protein (multidrug efflux system)